MIPGSPCMKYSSELNMAKIIDIEEPLESYRQFPGPVLFWLDRAPERPINLHRVKFLIDSRGALLTEICIVTFTTAAAKNMGASVCANPMLV